MKAPLPDPMRVLEALDTYLELAYAAAPPERIAVLVAPLRAAEPEAFYAYEAFERTGDDAAPSLRLRLGNDRYPFMKLALDPRPDQGGYLFKADTHDRHVCPGPESDEHEAFHELMEFNRALAQRIEAAWEDRGIPTFKAWLRADLARRTGKGASDSAEDG